MSLEALRDRNKNGKLDKLLKAAGRTSMGQTTFNNDQEEKYYPERDKSGNGSCILRFLPGLDSEDNPYYVERFQHGFAHNNKWYIEYCPSTLRNDCPVCEDNRDTIGEYGRWEDCPKNVQDVIRKRGRTVGFNAGNYCNVLVIKDPANPQNEGKVHLFSFGKGIMDMIMDMAQPQDDGLGDIPDPIDVFDLMEGANFKFIIRKKDGRADYSKSEFEKPSKCPKFDVDSQQALLPIIDESVFKSYDELSERLNKVTGNTTKRAPKNAEELVSDAKTPDSETPSDTDSGDTDAEGDGKDNMAYFQGIADEVDM